MKLIGNSFYGAPIRLYIERWLKAPVSMSDGTLVIRERGTPQGAVALRAWAWLVRLQRRQPSLFPHWSLAPTAGR